MSISDLSYPKPNMPENFMGTAVTWLVLLLPPSLRHRAG